MAAPTLEEIGLERLREARAEKAYRILDFREAYWFAAPHRQRQITSNSRPLKTPIRDESELNTDLAFDVTGEFVTEVVNTYMPEGQPWCEMGRGMNVPKDAFDKIKDKAAEDDATTFEAMKASNLYPELPKIFNPDLAIGTVGAWIDRKHPTRPITVLAVPLREIECRLGPGAEIDDRWAIRYTRNRYVREVVGEEIWASMPADIRTACENDPKQDTEVRFGFWRIWHRFDDEVWQSVVYIKDKLVHQAELVGEGCCPLIVGRWNPNADWAFGHGPLLQYLPSLRQIDELEADIIMHIDKLINGPIGYPDDSFAAIEQGLETGAAYPMRPDSKVVKIYDPGPVDPAVYQYEQKEHRLRRGFFVDFPEQTGDTPPTLGQWLDEMARAQRRIGTPGMPFWREVPAQIFLRFRYLLVRAGMIEPIKINGNIVALLPRNPAQAAAEQQEVGMTVKAIQILGQAFPEEFKVQIDGEASMKAILDKMRVKLLKFRDKDAIQAAVNHIAQLVKGHVPGAPDNPPGAASSAQPLSQP